jgi:hypothetical protein
VSTPPDTITCVECGGVAHLISYLPEEGELEPGYPLAYRCADCLDRFDMVWEEEEGEGGSVLGVSPPSDGR